MNDTKKIEKNLNENAGASKRVLLFLENQGITRYRFAKEIGASRGFLDMSENMGTDKASKILNHYPQLNPEWLITGKGSMLRDALPPEESAPPLDLLAAAEQKTKEAHRLLTEAEREAKKAYKLLAEERGKRK